MALAVLGSVFLWRQSWSNRLTLTLAAWLAACALFRIVGILTPIDMRYYLAAIPAVALLGSAGAAAAWRRGEVWRGVAIALLGGAVATGVHTWWSPLT